MNRRRLLALLAAFGSASVGGCLGSIAELNGDETDDSLDAGNEDSTDREDTRTLSLESVDDDLDELAFDVEFVTSNLSKTSIPKLDIRVENIGQGMVSWITGGKKFVFPEHGTTPPGLALSRESHIQEWLIDADGCRRIEQLALTDVAIENELEPGDVMEQRYAVVGGETALDDPCPPKDTVYRTEYEYEVGTWGFEIRVE